MAVRRMCRFAGTIPLIMTWQSDIETLMAVQEHLAVLDLGDDYQAVETAAYLMNQTAALPRAGIAFLVGHGEAWVSAAIQRVELRARRNPAFALRLAELERRLRVALGEAGPAR